jgi:serine/threonine protein kinase
MTREEPPVLEPGSALAPGYEVIEHMSRGNSLDVYDAWSGERECRCVAKLLRPDRAADTRPRRRLLREARLLQELSHPHIVRAYELVRSPQPVLILETLEGETVEHLAGRLRRRLPLGELAHLGLHMCSAMHYLHGRGYLHLDLKPSNVVAQAGLGKVIDLSLARRPGRGSAGVGTAQYMAPEQARGGAVGAATDVWGIGAVLYEAATGCQPFAASRVNGSRRYEQLERPVEPLASHRRAPRAFAALIGSSMEPEPRDRPTVSELSAALEAFAA